MSAEEIVATFSATLVGVLLGIPIAFWIDRRLKERKQKENAIAILSAIKEEITRDINLLKQVQNELRPNSIIYYNLDMNTWKATSLGTFEGIISSPLLRHIYRIYYEYGLLARKIDAQFSMHYGVVRFSKDYGEDRETIVKAILEHAALCEKESSQLITEIDAELVRLSKKSVLSLGGNQSNPPENTSPNSVTESKIRQLDHLFEVALILLGILSALESQYYTTLGTSPFLILRSFSVPFVLLIIVWLIKEVNYDVKFNKYKMLMTEFCWALLFYTLFYFMITLFAGLLIGITASAILSMAMIFSVILAYTRAYNTPSNQNALRFYLTKKWGVIRFLLLFGTYFLLVLLVRP